MGRLVAESIDRQRIRLAALRIIEGAGVPNRSDAGAARAIFNWVRTHVRYIPDPITLETVQAPEITMRLRAGDCDDHAALTTALLHSIGIPTRFVVIGTDRDNLRHIYTDALVAGRWRSLDTTRAARFGEPVPQLGFRKFYSWKGIPSMSYVSLGANASTAERGFDLPVDKLQAVAYRATVKTLKNNWAAGLISRADVVGYLKVIDDGNSPGRGTFAEPPMRQAIADFVAEIDRKGMISGKTDGQANGLEGLDGFLKSIWNGVKKAVSTAVKVLGGGGSVTVQPQINIPTSVPPETGKAMLADLLKSPLLIGAIALGLVLMLRRR